MIYEETTVRANGIKYTIKPGDCIIKDGIKYIFQWCTYQFDRYIDTSRPKPYNQINVEGGFYNVDAVEINGSSC